ncbi:hypothetical protein [Gordonia terrae]|uniref:hypothetical protein n=1 Tax=Gordonia terrae TaxID=2055 RepID=UPI003F6B34AA
MPSQPWTPALRPRLSQDSPAPPASHAHGSTPNPTSSPVSGPRPPLQPRGPPHPTRPPHSQKADTVTTRTSLPRTHDCVTNSPPPTASYTPLSTDTPTKPTATGRAGLDRLPPHNGPGPHPCRPAADPCTRTHRPPYGRPPRSDPDAAAALYQLGRLLAYLPLRSPKDEFWTVLGEHLGRAPDFLRTTLRALHTDIYSTTDRELADVDDLAHLLRYLPATPATAHALRGGTSFATDDIALLWLTSATTAAWTLWLHLNPDHLPH